VVGIDLNTSSTMVYTRGTRKNETPEEWNYGRKNKPTKPLSSGGARLF
jgi:hypothetical protein